jgi:hypothetical protein
MIDAAGIAREKGSEAPTRRRLLVYDGPCAEVSEPLPFSLILCEDDG